MAELNAPADPHEPPVAVLIVDDDPLVRQALRRMFAEGTRIAVVAEADDGDGVLEIVESIRPDVVLMDLRMARTDGAAATRALQSLQNPPPVLMLTTFETDEDIRLALQAGASGYLAKHSPPEQIEAAVREVAAGRPALSATVARSLMDAFGRSDNTAGDTPEQVSAARRIGSLTVQERAVAVAVAQGHSNTRIAGELFLSLSTVKAYISSSLAKLELDNRTQLALLVRESGVA